MSLCLCNTSISGGGTDFPNTRTVAGRIVHENGSPAPYTDLTLFADDFIPIDSQPVPYSKKISTDSGGYYHIEVSDTGIFNLYAINREQRTRLLVCGIKVRNDDTLVKVGDAGLTIPGVIKIGLPGSDKMSGFVCIRGTGFKVPVTTDDTTIIIDSVPAGIVPALYLIGTHNGEKVLLQDSTNVIPSDTTFVIPQNGSHSLKLILNTTDSGAGVTADVYNFPLAIRFSALPIAMNELLPDGSDLVITKADNTRLQYEIEKWDREHGEALVWVKVDTIYGNTGIQSIYLFWGKGQPSQLKANNVFDTSSGFSAVWHLNGGCLDATVNKHDGIRSSTVADTIGILGGAERFHGKDYFTINSLLGKLPTLTLSAWARLDTADLLGGEIVSIGDAALIRMDDHFNNRGCQGSYCSSPNASDTMTHNDISSGKFYAGTGWHYFSYVYDAVSLRHRFFIDGELAKEEQVTTPIQYDSIGTTTRIGIHGNGKTSMDFTGCIDEISVSHVARSAAWIKLCYMNQCSDNLLIKVKKKNP
jgi:hypothetical protein